jgi:uncharacterized protein (TIGR02145 family)
MKSTLHFFLVGLINLLPLLGCKKVEKVAKLPTVYLIGASKISNTSIDIMGQFTWNGDSPLLARGVCYSLQENPTISDSIIEINEDIADFKVTISGLTKNTNYFVRVYAKNQVGLVYSEQLNVKTANIEPQLATVITNATVSVTDSSVQLSAKVTNDGGTPILSKGFCISTSKNPTINDLKVEVSNTQLDFNGKIIGLTNNTIYYVRAFVLNSKGVNYGNEQIIKTYDSYVYDIEANKYGVVNIGNQYWLSENLKTTKFSDGSDIYATSITTSNIYGVYYNRLLDITKVCPVNWHVPSVSEWKTLIENLGGISVAGGKLKEGSLVEWKSPNTDATNNFMFSVRPTGINGNQYLGESAFIWTSEAGSYFPSCIKLEYNSSSALVVPNYYEDKIAIRCIKD